MSPYILDQPSAHWPYESKNAHIPYGVYTCPDGTQVLFDRAYVPTWARNADGSGVEAVPRLPDGRGRWVDHTGQKYFYIGGAWPNGWPKYKSARLRRLIEHGERILADFKAGLPIEKYYADWDKDYHVAGMEEPVRKRPGPKPRAGAR